MDLALGLLGFFLFFSILRGDKKQEELLIIFK